MWPDTAAKWVRMLRRFVIWAWIDYECSTSIAKFTPVTTIFFLLNKICDGGSSKEPFLKAATLSILIWAYPRETKTNNGNFKNAAILPSKVAYRWRACALILPLCHVTRHSGKMCAHAPQICDSSVNRLRMLHFNHQIHTCYHNIFFLLSKICDGGSSKEPFLKAATLSILIWAYPRETKTDNGNFKNAAISPRKIAHAWRACALILLLCHVTTFSLNFESGRFTLLFCNICNACAECFAHKTFTFWRCQFCFSHNFKRKKKTVVQSISLIFFSKNVNLGQFNCLYLKETSALYFKPWRQFCVPARSVCYLILANHACVV